jgi:hypothetical protein
MREKIAKVLEEFRFCVIGNKENLHKIFLDEANQILSLLRDKIEKIENPYDLNNYNYTYDKNQAQVFKEIWEDCRQKILKALGK